MSPRTLNTFATEVRGPDRIASIRRRKASSHRWMTARDPWFAISTNRAVVATTRATDVARSRAGSPRSACSRSDGARLTRAARSLSGARGSGPAELQVFLIANVLDQVGPEQEPDGLLDVEHQPRGMLRPDGERIHRAPARESVRPRPRVGIGGQFGGILEPGRVRLVGGHPLGARHVAPLVQRHRDGAEASLVRAQPEPSLAAVDR